MGAGGADAYFEHVENGDGFVRQDGEILAKVGCFWSFMLCPKRLGDLAKKSKLQFPAAKSWLNWSTSNQCIWWPDSGRSLIVLSFCLFQPQVFHQNKSHEAHKTSPPMALRASDEKGPLARKALQPQEQSSKACPFERTHFETTASFFLLALQILQAGSQKIAGAWLDRPGTSKLCWFFYLMGLKARIQNKCSAFATNFATFFNFFFLWPHTVETINANSCWK
jgi:hypothetical protein